MTLRLHVLIGLIALIAAPTEAFAQDGQPPELINRRALAEADLSRLKAETGGPLRVVWPNLRSTPARVSGLRWTAGHASAEETAGAFIAEFPGLTGVTPDELRLSDTERTKHRTVLHFRQTWGEVLVLGGEVILSLDAAGRVISMASSSARVDGLDATRDIGRKDAVRAAIARVHSGVELEALRASASKVVLPGPGASVLVWRVVVPTIPMVQKVVCLVDAATGEIIKVTDEVIR